MSFKVTITFNMNGNDPHVQAAILDMLREGIAPSRIGKREVQKRTAHYIEHAAGNVHEIADLNDETALEDEEDKIEAVVKRLGLE